MTRTHVFEVALTIENSGRATYVVDRIEDTVTGFQPIPKEAIPNIPVQYDVTMDCLSAGAGCDVNIDVAEPLETALFLAPGESFSVVYQLMPVLDVDPEDEDWAIGSEPVRVIGRREAENPTFDRPCVETSDDEPLADAVRSFWGSSRYLIVTNRSRLLIFYGWDQPDDYHRLLAALARLARYRGAMLAYVGGLDHDQADEIRTVIGEWGADMRGADMEAGGYLTDGYLLLVGDELIVPARTVVDADIADATADWPHGGVGIISSADNYYANIAGNSKPELVVGRMPGRHARPDAHAHRDKPAGPARVLLGVRPQRHR